MALESEQVAPNLSNKDRLLMRAFFALVCINFFQHSNSALSDTQSKRQHPIASLIGKRKRFRASARRTSPLRSCRSALRHPSSVHLVRVPKSDISLIIIISCVQPGRFLRSLGILFPRATRPEVRGCAPTLLTKSSWHTTLTPSPSHSPGSYLTRGR